MRLISARTRPMKPKVRPAHIRTWRGVRVVPDAGSSRPVMTPTRPLKNAVTWVRMSVMVIVQHTSWGGYGDERGP